MAALEARGRTVEIRSRSHMKIWKCVPVTLAAAAALVLAGLTSPAAADGGGGDSGVIRVQDRCDPATFNAAVGPGTCIPAPEGGVVWTKFLAALAANPAGVLAERESRGWRFHETDVTIRTGQDLVLVNSGGEVHTFTQVPQYGLGCVPPLNGFFVNLNQPPYAGDCDAAFATSAVLPGTTIHVKNLAKGSYKFECLVHPWMRTDVTVR
jgi:plastocyanin